MNRIFAFLFSLFILSFCGFSYSQITPQNMDKFKIMEDSLVTTADSMYEAFIPDTRIDYAERFVKQLVRALKIPNSYNYPFDSLGKIINIIPSDDGAFRIFNWEITPSKINKRYYGALQMPSEKLKLIPFFDYTEQIGKGVEDSILTNGKWYGGIIYRIMSLEWQGKKMYNLFSFNSSSPISNKKVIDPMLLDERGVRFGAPIFGVASTNFPRQRVNRFVIEYNKKVQATMNWDNEKKVVIFDKLVSQVNDPHRKYTYVPSGQYDALKWDNETWNYIRDIIPITILKDGEAPSDPSTPTTQDR